MAKIIKNIDNVAHIYSGQTIEAGSQYTIQSSEQHKWADDDSLMADISNGKAQVNDGNVDITGVSNQINHLKDIQAIDSDGRVLTRSVAAKSGWTYFSLPIEVTTSKLNSVYVKKFDGTDRTGVTYKIYDVNNVEITDAQNEVNAVKTVVDFEPTYDYEVIGGQIQQHTQPTTPIRVWVVGVQKRTAAQRK
jgi:hypothetical protein